MSESTKKVTPKQSIAIRELLQGAKIGDAAAAAGVNPRTLTRWLRDETFSAELRKAELVVMDGVGWRLISLADLAVDALADVLKNPGARGASVKRLCAKSILELLLHWRDVIAYEERLQALEEKINGQ